MNRENKGFTLIELLVVVAIISLLTSVVLASLNRAKTKAQDAKVITELRQLQTALELYHNDNGRYPLVTANTYYCIGATTCKIAGVDYTTPLSSAVPAFTYKPSSSFLVGNTRGFLYFQPSSGNPKIVLSTIAGGVQNVTTGTWQTTAGSN